MFAPTSRYGTPDDFKYLVNQCHHHNIGVILDWVPAHFPGDDHGLYRFDGTALYEYKDPQRGWHPDWKSWIYNYGSPWVQDFLISSALFWLDKYHVDGLRVDAVASMLYLDYSRKPGEWSPNIYGGNQNLEAVDLIKRLNMAVHEHYPDCMTIAEESTSWPGVSRPVNQEGLGFDYKWNMGWMNDSLSYMKHESVHRKYHHNEMTFSMAYAYSEDFVLPLSHDEVVYGKGTILTRMPGDDWQRFANLRAYLGFMYGHPGKKLLFMGIELGADTEWNFNEQLNWALEDKPLNAGIHKLVSDLNQIYKTYPALYDLEYDRNGFKWVILDDHDQSILAFCRMDKKGHPVLVI
ncbi:MAG: 1,4-alpha-glucan branching enzyme, partial [Endozoicomonas sp.]